MLFLPPNQQRQSTEGKNKKEAKNQAMAYIFTNFAVDSSSHFLLELGQKPPTVTQATEYPGTPRPGCCWHATMVSPNDTTMTDKHFIPKHQQYYVCQKHKMIIRYFLCTVSGNTLMNHTSSALC